MMEDEDLELWESELELWAEAGGYAAGIPRPTRPAALAIPCTTDASIEEDIPF